MIASIPRTATIRAAASSVLYRLDRDDFLGILSEYPDMKQRVHKIYLERMEKVKQEDEARAKAKAEQEAKEKLAAAEGTEKKTE